jgi:hypothetical protein
MLRGHSEPLSCSAIRSIGEAAAAGGKKERDAEQRLVSNIRVTTADLESKGDI